MLKDGKGIKRGWDETGRRMKRDLKYEWDGMGLKGRNFLKGKITCMETKRKGSQRSSGIQ